MSDALFFLALFLLGGAAFTVSIVLGLVVVAMGILIVAFALADGKGLRWR